MTSRIFACMAVTAGLSLCVSGQTGSVITPDPGITTTRLMDRPEIRVSRLEIQPGATRRVHQHDDVKYHLFVPLTGAVQMSIGSAKSVPAALGQVFFMEKGTPHGFKNAGASVATALEIFVKDGAVASNDALGLALALAGIGK